MKKLTGEIYYVGVDDKTLDLFEGQHEIPNGISYNSYVIMDEKIAIMDMVDKRAAKEWFVELERVLGDKQPDYLVMSHLEPDHCAELSEVIQRYPKLQIISNEKLFAMLPQFYNIEMEERKLVVKESDKLSLGKHMLHFFMAPMVHWPEVMVTYDATDKTLFSADAFGKFGALDVQGDWTCEARRYYFNIVGKYGVSVQSLLRKISALDVQMICPLHGPTLDENIKYYIEKYQTWSSYEPEERGVFIAYASMHGNTKQVVRRLVEILNERNIEKIVTADLARDDMSECIEYAFRYDRMIVACPTYDGAIMPVMQDFLYHLKLKAYQKRTIAIVENGSWAPTAGKLMKEQFEAMKEMMVMEPVVTIHSSIKKGDEEPLAMLADALCQIPV